VRTVIRYRNGVLNGKGASLLDGYMEDLATDRIYRLMIAQRMLHRTEVEATGDDGRATEHSAEAHSPEMITALFDEELEKILQEFAAGKLKDAGTPETFRAARRRSEEMIVRGQFNPV
jgi:malate synthase